MNGYSKQQRAILTLLWDEYQRARLPGQFSSEAAFFRYGVPMRPVARAVARMGPGEKWNRSRAASVSTSFRRLEIRGELRREGTNVRLTPSGVAAACRVAEVHKNPHKAGRETINTFRDWVLDCSRKRAFGNIERKASSQAVLADVDTRPTIYIEHVRPS